MGYGWRSPEFKRSAAITALSALMLGKGRLVVKGLDKMPYPVKQRLEGLYDAGSEAVTTLASWLSSAH